MNIIIDCGIIFAPIIGYFPQIMKVIKLKTDLGFNTNRITLLFNSTLVEILLNLSFNIRTYDSFSFHNYARLFSLVISFFGIIIKMIVKTHYSSNLKYQTKHNILNIFLTLFHLCLFLPLILTFPESFITTILTFLSTMLNFVIYIPQIYETCKIKKSGALSYLAVIFDYIGNLIIMIYLILNKMTSFYILPPVIITNINILILFSMMIYYDFYISNYKKYTLFENEEKEIEMINFDNIVIEINI